MIWMTLGRKLRALNAKDDFGSHMRMNKFGL